MWVLRLMIRTTKASNVSNSQLKRK
jgi:hypothetical protein